MAASSSQSESAVSVDDGAPPPPLTAAAGSQADSAVSLDASAPPPPPPPPLPLPPPPPRASALARVCCCCCRRRRKPCTRARVARALDSHSVHLVILLLIVIDVALLLCEILLSNVCPSAPAGSAAAATLHAWESGLSWTSRALVIALLLHQAALCAAEGPCVYVRQPLHVADAAILVAALVLELVLSAGDEAGLIAVLLGWRVLRVLHGLAATLEEAEHHADAGEAREKAQALQKQVDELTERLAQALGGGGGRAEAGGLTAPPATALTESTTPSAKEHGGSAIVA